MRQHTPSAPGKRAAWTGKQSCRGTAVLPQLAQASTMIRLHAENLRQNPEDRSNATFSTGINAGRKNSDEELHTEEFWRRGRESNRRWVLRRRKLLILEDALYAKTAQTAALVPIFGPIFGTYL
ncbi:MAG: hypothetical protein WA715_05405, partial [Candidatus Acidiferrum sp.]